MKRLMTAYTHGRGACPLRQAQALAGRTHSHHPQTAQNLSGSGNSSSGGRSARHERAGRHGRHGRHADDG